AADGNVIHELAGRPALARLRDAIEELTTAERGMVANGLLLGVVIDGGKPEYRQGDFLVRALLGADPEAGTVAVGAPIEPGTVVRMHARDATSADRDLRDALGLRIQALGGATPAGALVFTCNGRGRAMFGMPDHDALALDEVRAGAPAAGFFAAGEIGPGGGDPSALRPHREGASLVRTGRRRELLDARGVETGGRPGAPAPPDPEAGPPR